MLAGWDATVPHFPERLSRFTNLKSAAKRVLDKDNVSTGVRKWPIQTTKKTQYQSQNQTQTFHQAQPKMSLETVPTPAQPLHICPPTNPFPRHSPSHSKPLSKPLENALSGGLPGGAEGRCTAAPAVPPETLGSCPGSAATGRDREVRGATHNWPSVVRLGRANRTPATPVAGRAQRTPTKVASSRARYGPAFGGFAGAAVNFALAFVGQDDPVLAEVKTQFAEVNRKLDSITLQINSLKTEVQWVAYTSVYSQDELKISNSWDMFTDFLTESMAAKDKDKKRQLVEKFTQFYENTATENSVTNFYKYLTGDQPSLSKNLLELTVTKFSGEVEKVKTYSTYFRGLMWKGLQLNLVYYKLKDFNTEAKAKQSIIQFYNVTQAHTQTVLKCIENFEQYMKNDVKVIGTSEFLEMTPLATKVREFLNKKYFWYDWIVAVYKKEDASSHDMLCFTKISLEKFIVAVSFSEKGNHLLEIL
ncbi:uncharacterized protein LOC135538579 [Oncorhynchus masou masou]|uniref:uncharacterized protein LOC135538579 n=1 Tax=Oncorhynchus masou masou TaxID=90313 RepID=UPI003183AB4C